MVIAALGACGNKNGTVAGIRRYTPGMKLNPVGPSQKRGTPAPEPTSSDTTVLEGTWSTKPAADNSVRSITIKKNIMTYEEFNMEDSSQYFRADWKISITLKSGNIASMPNQISYTDVATGEVYQTEYFRIDANPAAVVIGASESDNQTFYKE